ncbi:MAG TPA: lysylphosphatidylglycerol synthase transmembrane domain-containing protein [Thermomicrobiales bacterium]|nr:TIGR00374 family protein [Chloroflexota bacterium]HQX62614.1 lysylphosphatidylglycerol synthase transmembrane domain-containing protein [Thermomicrobiales bacterium]HBY46555.1 TIGR00374 family protein [Chloroflexota bacterium]HCG29508.1 TIGR00374 family protein [Chloroflexota bacterium]HQZ90118.1 lysylphosphatidylglycerol synthase transmembrane domain-containing protein [Thermomicrobiales bacterium]
MTYDASIADDQQSSSAALTLETDLAAAAARPPSIGERLRSPQTIISFVVAFALIYFIFTQMHINIGDVWSQIRTANPALLFLAFAAYYGSFPFRAARWRRLLLNAGISEDKGYAIPNLQGLTEIYLLGWFANCVVPAKLGDAYRGYLLKKHAGPSFSRTLGTIFAERLLDVVALVMIMMLSALFVFHGSIPVSLRPWFIVGAVLVLIGLGGLLALMTASHHLQRLVPRRFRNSYLTLAEGIVTSFSRTGFLAVASLTVVVWILEGVRVYFGAQAIGVNLSFSAAIFVALLASLLTTIPFTPAGMGFVEGGTVLAVKLFGMTAAQATAVAIIDRAIASYSVILIGGLLYLVTKRK